MKPSHLVAPLIMLLAVCLSTNTPYLQAQANSPYADTTEGFQHFLQDILDATKRGDKQRVATLLRSTEVPNCDAWLHQMYKSDSADSWMSLCDSKTLASQEKSMKELFAGFAKEGGEFSTRKVNDNPEGGEGGLESGMVNGGKQPIEVYFALWKSSNQPREAKGEPIGYFYFLDGGFRWDSLVSFPKIKISKAKLLPAKLIKKVDPLYPPDAAAQGITGTVRVYYVIGGDGRCTTPTHFPARGYPRTLPSEKLQKTQSSSGIINQPQWTANQFKQMPSLSTSSSLQRADWQGGWRKEMFREIPLLTDARGVYHSATISYR
jgi:hypothetical protein